MKVVTESKDLKSLLSSGSAMTVGTFDGIHQGHKTLIQYVDRFLMFYVRTADRLQRTSVWLENLEGGLEEWTLYQEESIPKKST